MIYEGIIQARKKADNSNPKFYKEVNLNEKTVVFIVNSAGSNY